MPPVLRRTRGGKSLNTVQRFFRKYFLSSMGILFLFILINLVLAGVIFAVANSSEPSGLPVRRLAAMVSVRGGGFEEDRELDGILKESGSWAMLLNDGGTVVWEDRMPASLPRGYTAAQVARFSRWYLQDYPVSVWEHPAGLFVVGRPKHSVVKYAYSTSEGAVWAEYTGVAAVFTANLLLMLILFWRSTRRVEKAVQPVLSGIETMAHGLPTELSEQGELADICRELNRAADRLAKKETARAEWIRGVSHDIRTPLSIVLGYAGEMEDDGALPETARRQAGMIRRQGERLRKLVTDLNLVSKLEYSMQPLCTEALSPVELARRSVSGFLNGGLEDKYALALRADAGTEGLVVDGDAALLERMLQNLIQNSILHNPGGCEILVSVEAREHSCVLRVEDTGIGISAPLLARLNSGDSGPFPDGGAGELPHGLGLRLVRKIVRAHGGTVQWKNREPRGLTAVAEFPAHTGL